MEAPGRPPLPPGMAHSVSPDKAPRPLSPVKHGSPPVTYSPSSSSSSPTGSDHGGGARYSPRYRDQTYDSDAQHRALDTISSPIAGGGRKGATVGGVGGVGGQQQHDRQPSHGGSVLSTIDCPSTPAHAPPPSHHHSHVTPPHGGAHGGVSVDAAVTPASALTSSPYPSVASSETGGSDRSPFPYLQNKGQMMMTQQQQGGGPPRLGFYDDDSSMGSVVFHSSHQRNRSRMDSAGSMVSALTTGSGGREGGGGGSGRSSPGGEAAAAEENGFAAGRGDRILPYHERKRLSMAQQPPPPPPSSQQGQQRKGGASSERERSKSQELAARRVHIGSSAPGAGMQSRGGGAGKPLLPPLNHPLRQGPPAATAMAGKATAAAAAVTPPKDEESAQRGGNFFSNLFKKKQSAQPPAPPPPPPRQQTEGYGSTANRGGGGGNGGGINRRLEKETREYHERNQAFLRRAEANGAGRENISPLGRLAASGVGGVGGIGNAMMTLEGGAPAAPPLWQQIHHRDPRTRAASHHSAALDSIASCSSDEEEDDIDRTEKQRNGRERDLPNERSALLPSSSSGDSGGGRGGGGGHGRNSSSFDASLDDLMEDMSSGNDRGGGGGGGGGGGDYHRRLALSDSAGDDDDESRSDIESPPKVRGERKSYQAYGGGRRMRGGDYRSTVSSSSSAPRSSRSVAEEKYYQRRIRLLEEENRRLAGRAQREGPELGYQSAVATGEHDQLVAELKAARAEAEMARAEAEAARAEAAALKHGRGRALPMGNLLSHRAERALSSVMSEAFQFLAKAEMFLSNMPMTVGAIAMSYVTLGVVWFKFAEENLDSCKSVHFLAQACTFPEFPGCFDCDTDDFLYKIAVHFHYFCSTISGLLVVSVCLKIILAGRIVLDDLSNPTTSSPFGLICMSAVCVFAGRGTIGKAIVLTLSGSHLLLTLWFVYTVRAYGVLPDPSWYPNLVGIGYSAVKTWLYYPYPGIFLMVISVTSCLLLFPISVVRVWVNKKISAPVCWIQMSAPSITLYTLTLMAQPTSVVDEANLDSANFLEFHHAMYLPVMHFMFALCLIGFGSSVHALYSRRYIIAKKAFSPAHAAFCFPTLSHANAVQAYRGAVNAFSNIPPGSRFKIALFSYWLFLLVIGTLVLFVLSAMFFYYLPSWAMPEVETVEGKPPEPSETLVHDVVGDTAEMFRHQPFVNPAVLQANETGALVRVRRGVEDSRGPYVRTRNLTALGFDPIMPWSELNDEIATLLEYSATHEPRQRKRTLSVPGIDFDLRFGSFGRGNSGVFGTNAQHRRVQSDAERQASLYM